MRSATAGSRRRLVPQAARLTRVAGAPKRRGRQKTIPGRFLNAGLTKGKAADLR